METALWAYLFHSGSHFRAYEQLGCHAVQGTDGWQYTFRTSAPQAVAAAVVVGDDRVLEMQQIGEKGIWEASCTTGESLGGQPYRFRFTTADGGRAEEGDPYAFLAADGRSLVSHPSCFVFSDGEWMERRGRDGRGGEEGAPLQIYLLHAGSFLRRADGGCVSYAELGDVLVPYLKYLGCTHAAFLPLWEGEGSVAGAACYAPAARYGGADDLRRLIDRLHTAGIGVLMAWSPASLLPHFDPWVEEEQCFLISHALYWLREFHIDGLCVGGVGEVIYRAPAVGEEAWFPATDGERVSREAVAFWRKLSSAVEEEFPQAILIADGPAAFPGLTDTPAEGGLGFRFACDAAFADEMLAYLGKDPLYRRYHHGALTAFASRPGGARLLAITHRSLAPFGGSLYAACYGSHAERLDTIRAFLTFFMTLPGKKLFFMGSEWAETERWYPERGIGLHLLAKGEHRALRDFTAALQQFCLAHPALWETDGREDGFAWIEADRADENMVAYRRRAAGGEELLVLVSFSGADLAAYCLPVAAGGVYDVLFFSGAVADAYPSCFSATPGERGPVLRLPLPARTALVLSHRMPGLAVTLHA